MVNEYPMVKYLSEKLVNITGTDRIHLNCDCINGSIVSGKRQAILCSFGLDKPPGYKVVENPNIIQYIKTK